MNKINFANWLIKEIDERGWSQADLSRASGITTGGISNLLNQVRNPSPEALTALAHALGYPPEYVFRQAGLLPPKKGAADPAFDRFEARLALLTPENRERIYRLIEFEYQLQLEQEAKALSRQTGTQPQES